MAQHVPCGHPSKHHEQGCLSLATLMRRNMRLQIDVETCKQILKKYNPLEHTPGIRHIPESGWPTPSGKQLIGFAAEAGSSQICRRLQKETWRTPCTADGKAIVRWHQNQLRCRLSIVLIMADSDSARRAMQQNGQSHDVYATHWMGLQEANQSLSLPN